MTVTEPQSRWTFQARLVEDEFGMLWLHEPNSRGERMTTFLLSALKTGWRLEGHHGGRASAA
jgi:hypothetical protein